MSACRSTCGHCAFEVHRCQDSRSLSQGNAAVLCEAGGTGIPIQEASDHIEVRSCLSVVVVVVVVVVVAVVVVVLFVVVGVVIAVARRCWQLL